MDSWILVKSVRSFMLFFLRFVIFVEILLEKSWPISTWIREVNRTVEQGYYKSFQGPVNFLVSTLLLHTSTYLSRSVDVLPPSLEEPDSSESPVRRLVGYYSLFHLPLSTFPLFPLVFYFNITFILFGKNVYTIRLVLVREWLLNF